MLSQEAKSFMEFCISAYKESGKNEFYISDYMHIPNYEAAISELIEKGLLDKKMDILETISINFDALKS